MPLSYLHRNRLETMDRMDASRCAVPVPLPALSLWVMFRLWRDEHDRQQLALSQRACRLKPQHIAARAPRQLSPEQRTANAIKVLVSRAMQARSYNLRLLFAWAARDQARAYKISRPYDILAAYCGLVDRRIPEGALPVEMASMLGGHMVEERMATSGDPYSAALSVASETCEAIVDFFGDGEYPRSAYED